MNKKKHQRGPDASEESSESGDENQNRAECPHISKAVDFNKVKKLINTKGVIADDCEECKKMPATTTSTDLTDAADFDFQIDVDMSLWLCLKCGNQACGRGRNMHALKHYNTPRSDSHAICLNTTHWGVWCYDCDNDVNATCKKKLLEVVEYVRKLAESKKAATNSAIANKSAYTLNTSPEAPCDTTVAIVNDGNGTGALPKKPTVDCVPGLPRARGLANLGNTCFFNSVMQCLGQTPYLTRLLFETAEPGQFFKLPGGKLKMKDKEEVELPPLEGETEKWRPLPQSLAETLRELQSGRAEVFNPRNLLNKLTAKMPQFGGGDQHDSHELLRYLLEAVREEDQKRFKAVILEKLGCRRPSDPSAVEEEKKQIIKFYGQQVSEMLLATEQVFRGALVSTLQCQVCNHLSHREEKFLDLSLPISEKQLAPVLRRKAEEIEDNKPSKHQMKKEKRAEKKKNKKQKHSKNHNNILTQQPSYLINEVDVSMENKSDNTDDESDADVEDNVEETTASSTSTVIALPGPGDDFSAKGGESGYNSDKVDNSSPDSNRVNSPVIDDSGVPSPGVQNCDSIPMNSHNNSPASSETNVDMGSPLLGTNSPDEDSFARPMSRLAFVENNNNKNIDLKEDLEKLSLLNDGDSAKVDSIFVHNQTLEGACAMELSNDMMDQGEDDEDDNEVDDDGADDDENDPHLYSGTLAPRYQCEEGECSVESCLNQFTECELLMGSNKVQCDLCTKRSGTKKPVCTDASKQLLIYKPPAVLILHLKRFQVFRFRSAKVSKFVKFSTLLDLGPFCSKRAHNSSTVQPNQSKVLYSLYGVVEHSGTMYGGHYVAYVKVRAPLKDDDPRWQFIPKNQTEKIKNLSLNADGEPEVPSGKWYNISDSYVAEVSEGKVLNAQAYLLFYERLL